MAVRRRFLHRHRAFCDEPNMACEAQKLSENWRMTWRTGEPEKPKAKNLRRLFLDSFSDIISSAAFRLGSISLDNQRRKSTRRRGGERRKKLILSGKHLPSSDLRVSAPPVRFFSRFDEPQGRRKDPHETPQSHIIHTICPKRSRTNSR